MTHELVLSGRRTEAGPGWEAPGGAAELEQRRQRGTLRPEERERHHAKGESPVMISQNVLSAFLLQQQVCMNMLSFL